MSFKCESDTFCIADYDAIGFDLDGCLFKYKWDAFFKYTHEYLTACLEAAHGYGSTVIGPYQEGWKSVMCRGLVIDKVDGNFLRVLADGTITKAYHGREELSAEKIVSTYPGSKLPVIQEILADFKPTNDFHLVDNPFECPLLMIYSDLLAAYHEKILPPDCTCKSLWDQMWLCYLSFYVPQSTDMGPRFIDVPKCAGDYGVECSRELRNWLKRLKAANKCVFLMTSSAITFTKGVLNFILGPDHADYFEFGIGRSMKPSFFHKKDQPFVNVACRDQEVIKLEKGCWYEFGCLDVFTPFLKEFTGLPRPKVLYVGDGIKNDAFPAFKFANWGSLLILEALEVEKRSMWPENIKSPVVEKGDEAYMGNNPVWGSFLAENGTDTLFGHVARESSCIIVPWLDYITDLPLDHRYPMYDKSGRKSGYYPPLEGATNS